MAVVRVDIEINNKGEATLKQTAGHFDKVGDSAVKAGLAMGAGMAVGERALDGLLEVLKSLTEGVAHSIEHLVEYSHEIEIAAAKTGLSTGALQSLSVAARLSGTDLGSMTTMVGKMQKALGESKEAFAALGLSVQKLKTMSPDEAFRTVIERLGQIKNQSELAAAGSAIFGKAWQQIAPVIKDPELFDAADKLGAKLGKDDVEAAAALALEGRKLSVAWEGVQLQFAAALASNPALKQALEVLVTGMSDLAHWVHENQGAISSLADAAIKEAVVWFKQLWEWAGKAGGALAYLAEKVAPGIHEALRAANEAAITAEAVRLAKEALAPKKPTGGGEFDPHEAEAIKKRVAAIDKAMADYKRSYEAMENEITAFRIRTHRLATEEEKKYWDEQYRQADAYGKWYLHYLQAKQAAEKAIAEAWAREQQRMADEDLKNLADLGHAVEELGKLFGSDLLSGIGGFISQLAASTKRAMEATNAYELLSMAIEGVANAYATGKAGASPGKGALKGAMSGAATGAGIGTSIMPGYGTAIGAVAGAVIGGVAGWIGGKKGQAAQRAAEAAELAALNAELDRLMAQAKKAGTALNLAFDPKNAQSLKKAIDEINAAMDLQGQAQKDLQDAIDRYGFTIDELGPKLSQQKLDEQFGQLYKDYQLLTAAGVDHNAILERMGPSINDYVNQAIKAGDTIPAAMKPIIDELIASGKLVDENGKAYDSAEGAGIKYAETLTEGIQHLIDKITELVNALLGIPNVDRDINLHTHRTGGGTGDDGTGDEGNPRGRGQRGEGRAQGFEGWVLPRAGGVPLNVAEAGRPEYVRIGDGPERGGGGLQVNQTIHAAPGTDVEAVRRAARQGLLDVVERGDPSVVSAFARRLDGRYARRR